jgi:hypothetical protein
MYENDELHSDYSKTSSRGVASYAQVVFQMMVVERKGVGGKKKTGL